MDHASRSLIDWGAAVRPCAGETESGDGYLVTRTGTAALIAVVDGLGHGPEAAVAARTALAVIESHAGETLSELLRWCHAALRNTRGVVITLAAIDTRNGTLTWVGVGNVVGALVRAHNGGSRESLVLRGGVIGDRVTHVTPTTLPIFPGDTLVFATDGVRWDPHAGAVPTGKPDDVARRLLDQNASDTDDALVVVARYQTADT
jgi:serine phosphatase RsbU (regulator of sigma subunit)